MPRPRAAGLGLRLRALADGLLLRFGGRAIGLLLLLRLALGLLRLLTLRLQERGRLLALRLRPRLALFRAGLFRRLALRLGRGLGRRIGLRLGRRIGLRLRFLSLLGLLAALLLSSGLGLLAALRGGLRCRGGGLSLLLRAAAPRLALRSLSLSFFAGTGLGLQLRPFPVALLSGIRLSTLLALASRRWLGESERSRPLSGLQFFSVATGDRSWLGSSML